MKSVKSVKKETRRLVSNAIWIAECHDKGQQGKGGHACSDLPFKVSEYKKQQQQLQQEEQEKPATKAEKITAILIPIRILFQSLTREMRSKGATASNERGERERGGREPKEMEPVRVPGHAAGNNRSWNKEERGRAAAEAEAQFKTK